MMSGEIYQNPKRYQKDDALYRRLAEERRQAGASPGVRRPERERQGVCRRERADITDHGD